MYNIFIMNIANKYEYNELIKEFISQDEFRCFCENEETDSAEPLKDETEITVINESGSSDKNQIKREIYHTLRKITGEAPAWGILTGVRPIKLAGEIYDRCNDLSKLREILREEYLISREKIDLIVDTLTFQREKAGVPPKNSVGIYIGIPFCPTRCVYCSFASNQVGEPEIERYLEALKKEICFVGKGLAGSGLIPETIYIGGGTPTTLSSAQLNDLLSTVRKSIDMSHLREFTVEAGRPDTITPEKLAVLREHKVDRISINPQSMKEKTLELIGRSHKPEDIVKAFHMAKEVGFEHINADLICGLPEENADDYKTTLDKTLALEPDNVTVHTLAVKRASKLIEVDKDFHFKQADIVKEMLDITGDILKSKGFTPYYLYRQKHMAGALENVGYCRGNTPCIYNIRIMEERQTIIAMGAGGISKVYYPDENRLERVANVTNYEIYISRIDEMLDRKENNIFKEV